jgi:hypothetical protein
MFPRERRFRVRHVSLFWRVSLILGALAIGCGALVAAGVWNSAAFRKDRSSKAQLTPDKKLRFHAKLRDGIGREVRFAKSKASPQRVNESVESVSNFVRARSGIEFDGELKSRLAELEQRTLNGESRRLDVELLVDVLTETALGRLSAVDDQEIERAAETLSRGRSDLTLRANGRGYFKKSEFVAQVKAAREQSLRGDDSLRRFMRAEVRAEVEGRVALYGEALPEKFGRVKEDGLTPLQAVLITYSVVADDLMHLSRSNLLQQMQREHQALGAMGDSENAKPDKAYGPHGYYYSSPLDLVFEKRTLNDLLNRLGREVRGEGTIPQPLRRDPIPLRPRGLHPAA